MEMRVPSGGSFLDSLGTTLPRGSDAAVDDVTIEQLQEALGAIRQGHIEYIVLSEGDSFLQIAGDGDGPYQVEYNPGRAEDQIRSVAGAPYATAAAAMQQCYLLIPFQPLPHPRTRARGRLRQPTSMMMCS